jgi:hypothetical protein
VEIDVFFARASQLVWEMRSCVLQPLVVAKTNGPLMYLSVCVRLSQHLKDMSLHFVE